MLSHTEENYLKAIYHLSSEGAESVSTNALAGQMNTSAASITDMMKKLSAKKLIRYERYRGVSMTEKGSNDALAIIRKHRLWETFLVEKLGFKWDEVHEVAEQLEHVQSRLLVDKLDQFLGYPKSDPHGDWIPDRNGKYKDDQRTPLSEAGTGSTFKIKSIRDDVPGLLQYMTKVGIGIGAGVKIIERREFDGSMDLIVENKKRITLSKESGEKILVTRS